VYYDNADLFSVIDKEVLQQIEPESRMVKFGNTIFVEGHVIRSALHTLKNS